MHIFAKFQGNPSSKQRNIASREIGVNGRTPDYNTLHWSYLEWLKYKTAITIDVKNVQKNF